MSSEPEPAVADRTLLGVALALAAAATIGAVLLPTDALAARMAHPVRLDAAGGIPATTLEGATALRIALGVGPWALLLLLVVAKRIGHGAPSAAPVQPIGRGELAGLVLAILVGTALRLAHIGDSLWYDEIAGLLGYSIHGPLVVAGNYFSQANHPFSQILIWASTALFGVFEATLRLPSLLAGVGAVPAIWLLGRAARGAGFGLLAAIVLALAPVAVLASSDGRGYSLTILLATIATWLLLRVLAEPRRRLVAAYAIVAALLAWSHLAAACVVVGHAAVLLPLLRRPGARSALVATIAGGVCALCLHAPLLPDLLARSEAFRTTSADQPRLIGPETARALLAWGGSWTWWAALPGLLLALVGAATALRDRRIGFVVLLAGAGAPIALLLAVVGDSWLYARFLLFATPAAALLIAAGLGTLAAAGRTPLVVATGLLALAWGAELVRTPPRQPLREALLAAAAPIEGRQPRLASLGLNDQVLLLYAQAFRIPIEELGLDAPTIAARLERLRPDRVVVLYPDHRPEERLVPLRDADFERETMLEGWIDWGAGRVEIWRRRPRISRGGARRSGPSGSRQAPGRSRRRVRRPRPPES